MKTKTTVLIFASATVAAMAAAVTLSDFNHGSPQTPESPPATLGTGAGPAQSGAAWHTDFAEACRLAQAQGKPLLLGFTGSDWCGWCMKLDREIFATSEFQDYAAKHLVLVKLDFPRHHELSPAERGQNERLAAQFDVQGFPTLVVLDAGAHPLGTLGYMPGGPQPLLAKLAEVTHGKNPAPPSHL